MARILLIIVTCLFFSASPVLATISFEISIFQQQADELILNVSLSGLSSSSCPNTTCYLQGMFTALDSPRYFGFTQNNDAEFIEYVSSPQTDDFPRFFIVNPQDGTWTGQVLVKNNPDDSDYHGPGDYALKLKRYTGNSSSGSDSNILSVTLYSPQPPSPTSSPSFSEDPTEAITPTPTATPKPPTATLTFSPTSISQTTVSHSPTAKSVVTSTSPPSPTATLRPTDLLTNSPTSELVLASATASSDLNLGSSSTPPQSSSSATHSSTAGFPYILTTGIITILSAALLAVFRYRLIPGVKYPNG